MDGTWIKDGNNYILTEENTSQEWREINQSEQTREEKLNEIRIVRNKLLADSDWTQLSDVSLTEEQIALWRVYRHQLRDLTEIVDVDSPVYPEKPFGGV